MHAYVSIFISSILHKGLDIMYGDGSRDCSLAVNTSCVHWRPGDLASSFKK